MVVLLKTERVVALLKKKLLAAVLRVVAQTAAQLKLTEAKSVREAPAFWKAVSARAPAPVPVQVLEQAVVRARAAVPL
jgi:hypothetical protein